MECVEDLQRLEDLTTRLAAAEAENERLRAEISEMKEREKNRIANSEGGHDGEQAELLVGKPRGAGRRLLSSRLHV